MKRVKIVDYYAVNTFHEVVNYSFIKLCAASFEQVKYLCGKSAGQNLQRLTLRLDGSLLENVRYIRLPNFENDTPIGARMRDLWGFFLTLYQYLITPYDTLLFYNYTNKFSLPFILLLNILLRKRILFVFHGELEFLVGRVSYLKFSGWYKMSMVFSFHHLFMKSPSYVLILGDSIRKNLCSLYPHLLPRVLSICHPYIFDNSNNHAISRTCFPIRIGTVGTMKKDKGLQDLLSLSDLLQDLLQQKELELYCVGRVYAVDIQLNDKVHWIGYEKGLPRNEFERQIQQLDYLLYLYPVDSYRFTASGAILDAIKMRKPIISLHNDYFNYLLDGCSIGYIRNSVEELAQVIREIIAGRLKDDFSMGFEGLSKKVGIEKNAKIFKDELRRINFV